MVILGLPALYMLVGGLIYTVWLCKRTNRRQRTVSIQRLVEYLFALILFLIPIVQIIVHNIKSIALPPAEIYNNLSWALLAFSWLWCLVLYAQCTTKAEAPGPVLSVFFALVLIVNTIKMRTYVNDWRANGTSFDIIFFLVYYCLSTVFSVIGIFFQEDPSTEYQLIGAPDEGQGRSPELGANLFSILTFWWMNRLMKTGYKRPLEHEDLYTLRDRDSSEVLSEKFERAWAFEVVNHEAGRKASLVRALRKAFGRPFFEAIFFKAMHDGLLFAGPLIMNLLILFVQTRDPTDPHYEPGYMGWVYAGAMIGCAITQSCFLHQYFHRCFRTGMNTRSGVVTAVYRKSLRLSSKARQEGNTGKTVNLMSVDAQRFQDMAPYLHMIWSAPLQIVVSLSLLYVQLGYSIFAGLLVMILMIPINFLIAKKLKAIQGAQMKLKDGRIKSVGELLNGMKIIKLYAWEDSFLARILEIREGELAQLRRAAFFRAGTSLLWYAAPLLVSIATFTLYTTLGNPLTSAKAFTAIALFNILRFPLNQLPQVIASLAEASVSVKRLQEFLLGEEIDRDAVLSGRTEAALEIANASFSWDGEEATLDDVSLSVRPGELVAVIGEVGSGKSSLLSAILGEIRLHGPEPGSVEVNGTVAYVAQEAWIQNATLEENILFGAPAERTRYDRVVETSCLRPDLEMLPAGDQTEIGEKGINLSGGQKQRVAIARAIYADADIYLFDDPLSALDAHVGKEVFDSVLGAGGCLAGKTRVLVTHGEQYLPRCGRIVVLKGGRVAATGSYEELVEAGYDFAVGAEKGEEEEAEIGSPRPPVKGSGLATAPEKKPSAPEGKLIEKEARERGKVAKGVYLEYMKAISVPLAILVLFLYVLVQGMTIFNSWWLAQWTEAADAGDTEHSLGYWLGIYGGIGFGCAVVVMGRQMFLVVATLRSARNLFNGLLTRISRAPMSFFDTTPTGRILNRFSKDQYVIDEVLPNMMGMFLYAMLSVVGTVVIIALATVWFLVALIPIALVFYFFEQYYLRASRELKRLDSVSRSPIYAHFGESLTGIPTIRAYAKSEAFAFANSSKLDHNQRAYYMSIASNRWLAMRLELMGSLIVFLAAMFAVLERENLSPGLVGLAISYALNATQTLNWAVRMATAVETNIVSVERVKEYSNIGIEAAKVLEESRPPASWPSKGEITMENLQVRYREGLDVVLKGIDVKIEGGEKVGICGRTGAGKSTITIALFRLVELAGGSITIDGINISDIGLHDLRSKITIIPQDPLLFSGTIRSNMDPFDTYTDGEIWDALEKCNLKAYASAQKEALAAPVAENGENLSVGQRQLLCLGRALLRQSKILVLDEATAAVDYDTDSLIQATIRKAFAGCTVLTIAHRINTIIDYDKIMVLDKGELKEFGSPGELLELEEGIFSSLCKEAGVEQ